MDVNATLARIRELSSPLAVLDADEAAELAELIHALDEWISTGGFLPAAWQRGHATARTDFTRGAVAYTRGARRTDAPR
jgi:hypothetical protein